MPKGWDNVGRTAKLTVSPPEGPLSFANGTARKKTSPGKVLSTCLMEGYRAMAKEQRRLAVMASKIGREVIPEWR
ncbi:MAG: hypothetical protein AB1597_06785 [Chloroflexota bacterium]